MTQSLFYEQPVTSSLEMSDNDAMDVKHADHEIIVEKNLCQIMDSVIFNNDFLLIYHEIAYMLYFLGILPVQLFPLILY